MEKVFKNSLESFSNHQTALKELNVESFLQTNMKGTQNSSKFIKSQRKNIENKRILKNRVLRQFSNQNYLFVNNNQNSDILKNFKIKDFYNVQKPQSSQEPNQKDQIQNQFYDISEKSSIQIKEDSIFSSQTKSKKYEDFQNFQQVQLFRSAQSIKKHKQSQRALYLIKNHLELINFKVNQIQFQLKQSSDFQSNISSNRLKKLNKLLRLLKIVQKFALQAQTSQQLSQNNQFESFYSYSESSKQKYLPNFNYTQQKQKRIKNLKQQFQQIITTNKLKESFRKKQQQDIPQVLLSPNGQIKTFIKSQIKLNIKNTQEKESKPLKFISLRKNLQQTQYSKSLQINQCQQDSVRKKLFPNDQNQLYQKQSQKTSIISNQKINYQKQKIQNQGQKIQKQTFMAIKCLNLSIHVLNLFRHSFSQKFSTKNISTEQNCQLLSSKQTKFDKYQNNQTNRKKVEIKQIRNLLIKLKQQSQKVYDTCKDQQNWNSMSKKYACFSGKKQKNNLIKSKIEQIYNATKSIFRKLQRLCLDTNKIDLKNCY